MATRSFLIDSEVEQGLQKLIGPPGSGAFPAEVRERRMEFSLWLEQCLLRRFESLGDFAALKPVLLGSWSRRELCPKSDIDLLFTGDEDQVQEFVAKAFRHGLKLRARTP